jgi:hypothetical protein
MYFYRRRRNDVRTGAFITILHYGVDDSHNLAFGIVSLPWIFRVCPRPSTRIRPIPNGGKGQFRTKGRGPSSLCPGNQGVRIEYLGGTPNVRLPNNTNGTNRQSRRV